MRKVSFSSCPGKSQFAHAKFRARIRKESQKYTANDLQRSARNTACAMQQDTKALQVSKLLPRKSRMLKGETADCTGLSLTCLNYYLAT